MESEESTGVYHGRAGSRRIAKLAIAFCVFHLAMTVLYLGPTPGPIRRVATAYMEPVFKQSWWVFAPDPVSSNKYLLVRAKKADGTQTPWFNITSCDVHSAILHHPVPDRRYLSSFQLMRHYELGRDNLPAAAKQVLSKDFTGHDWARKLETELASAGATPTAAHKFLKSDRAANNFASRVAKARWGDDIASVQTQIKEVHTRPFDRRDTNDPLRTETWTQGYLTYTPGDAEENTTFAELYGPKGGC